MVCNSDRSLHYKCQNDFGMPITQNAVIHIKTADFN